MGKNNRKEEPIFEIQLDTIKLIPEIHKRAVESDWVPGEPSMTDEDHLRVIEELRARRE